MSQNARETGRSFHCSLRHILPPYQPCPPLVPPAASTRDIKARRAISGGEGGRGCRKRKGGRGRQLRGWWGCLGYDWLSEGVNPGLGHTPPRLNPPLTHPPVVPERMAAGVRVFLDNPGARGLIEILVAATWKGEREILMDSLDGWKLWNVSMKKGLR